MTTNGKTSNNVNKKNVEDKEKPIVTEEQSLLEVGKASIYVEQLRSLLRHISLIQNSAQILGEKIIREGDYNFGRMLIANAQSHDHSKFGGLEWKYLVQHGNGDKSEDTKGMQKVAIEQHRLTNPHHPEYWQGIDKMPDVYIAEMVCDWYARSHEAATDLREWIKNTAVKTYGISTRGKVYKTIKRFVDLLLDPMMQKIQSNNLQ